MEEVPEDPYKARCKLDGKTFRAKYETLVNHNISQDHQKAAKLDDLPPKSDFSIPKRTHSKFERSRTNTELQIVGMAGSLNLHYRKIPELVQRMRYIHKNVPDSPVHTIKLGKTKARDLAVNVITMA